MKLFLSPHNDDECLFAAYTLMREKPLVVIVTDRDAHLAQGISAEQRREESRRACDLLGVPVVFLGLKDGTLEQQRDDLRRRLEPFASQPWTHIYAPAFQGGHKDHDALAEVVSSMFSPVSYYATYAPGESYTPAGRLSVMRRRYNWLEPGVASTQYAAGLSTLEIRHVPARGADCRLESSNFLKNPRKIAYLVETTGLECDI